ncbi:hypothetical protein IQ249_04850 [Lusitaniella coriacea LEGE 07157]|uniref:Uncharacterized protein n=1 Tax=Lusitaniella coriacea LEGE 07157 TaxID=945747 RepID=A0A8J7DNV3_9CYAN|nr:hypothetical protein [Lusitaniella coriacea]MBE9115224.1 hypothetical protein [Lusitaniella coriacea LEGE 07157]
MSSLEKRLQAFRQLPLQSQLMLIFSFRLNPQWATDSNYLEQLKRIHAECLMQASLEQKAEYERVIAALTH